MKTSKLKTSDPESKLSRKSLQHKETKPRKKQFKLKMQHTEQSIHREQTYQNKQCLGSEVTRNPKRWDKFEMEKTSLGFLNLAKRKLRKHGNFRRVAPKQK